MARILADTDVTVSVAPYFDHWATPKDPEVAKKKLRDAADEIARLVKRHVAPHSPLPINIVPIAIDNFKCSGCGGPWTEKSTTYNGGCCLEDEKHNPETITQAAAKESA